ncbi:hypothetical protein CgunFtcFv8_019108 [Champsocephalus gunnari]|uniref:Uncharacterized protein n=1 Tax=Champsocephalus gunnari TaxID=52237 RepID=A0AAN8DH82_CHAGU|nr:hypothetical protein CgunFtcFv8_019108 [Champsocephalus gunnari]
MVELKSLHQPTEERLMTERGVGQKQLFARRRKGSILPVSSDCNIKREQEKGGGMAWRETAMQKKGKPGLTGMSSARLSILSQSEKKQSDSNPALLNHTFSFLMKDS